MTDPYCPPVGVKFAQTASDLSVITRRLLGMLADCKTLQPPSQSRFMPPRSYILFEANYAQLKSYRPNVAVLPWGATEAHNYHMPHGTDVVEARTLAERAAKLAFEAGAKPIVLPAIPFGNNAQQMDQVATINISTATASAILGDVAQSLKTQGIDRLVILNAHGGNEFKPIVRDLHARL